MQVVIYKTPDCPRCRVLAAHLERLGIDFEAGYLEEVLRR